MKTLVIYDLTGKVWNIVHGAEEKPEGLLSMFVDIPMYAYLEKIDVSDPENHKPVFKYMPDNNVGELEAAIRNLTLENNELKSQLATANEELLMTQLAIAEMYEANLSEDETTEQEVNA